MTIKRVQIAAARRGIYFDGTKKFRNTMVGYAYSVHTPYSGFFQADTLDGLYRKIMEYPVLREED